MEAGNPLPKLDSVRSLLTRIFLHSSEPFDAGAPHAACSLRMYIVRLRGDVYCTIPTNPVGHCHQGVRRPDFGSIIIVIGGSAASLDSTSPIFELEVIRVEQNLCIESSSGPEQVQSGWNVSSLGVVELGSAVLPCWDSPSRSSCHRYLAHRRRHQT